MTARNGMAGWSATECAERIRRNAEALRKKQPNRSPSQYQWRRNADSLRWVIDHAERCAQALHIDLDAVMYRTPFGSLNRNPANIAARSAVWKAMRETGAEGGQIPSFPMMGAVFGISHTTILAAVQRLSCPVEKPAIPV